jgi:hypothetical protein
MSPSNSIVCVQNDFRAYGTCGANSAPNFHRHYLQTDRKESPHDQRHLAVPSCVSKMISEPTVHSVLTVLLTSTDTNTISKQTISRFHKIHVTYKFHRVRLKYYPSLWYVRHKLRTYLASRLALSPNGPKRASTLPSSPRSTIGCVQKDF